MAVLQPIADDVWTAAHDLKMFGVHFPGRMTVVRLQGGALWLHSPVPIDDALAAELEALGPVRYLVAPNRYHHLHMGLAIERFPKAEVWAAPGLASKRPDLRIDRTLGETDPPWADEIGQHLVQGAPELNESVFLHRASGSLVFADLAFNVHECDGLMSRMVYRMAGAWQRFEQSRLWRRFTRDRDAARDSVETILAWDFERVIPCHGKLVEEDAKAALRTALWWMRGAAKRAAA